VSSRVYLILNRETEHHPIVNVGCVSMSRLALKVVETTTLTIAGVV
jgi:hypothetical protein